VSKQLVVTRHQSVAIPFPTIGQFIDSLPQAARGDKRSWYAFSDTGNEVPTEQPHFDPYRTYYLVNVRGLTVSVDRLTWSYDLRWFTHEIYAKGGIQPTNAVIYDLQQILEVPDKLVSWVERRLYQLEC